MLKKNFKLFNYAQKIFDFVWVFLLFSYSQYTSNFSDNWDIGFCIVASIVYIVSCEQNQLYESLRIKALDSIVYGILKVWLVEFLFIVIWKLNFSTTPILNLLEASHFILQGLIVSSAIMLGAVTLLRILRGSERNLRLALLITDSPEESHFEKILSNYFGLKITQKFLVNHSKVKISDEIERILNSGHIDLVFVDISIKNVEKLMLVRRAIYGASIPVYFSGGMDLSQIVGHKYNFSGELLTLYSWGRAGPSVIHAISKMVTDRIGGIALLIILSPALLIIAYVIKCQSPGPAFFKQRRVGQYGKTFTIYKFRSMYQDSNSGNQMRNRKYGYGITPLGKFLRKNSLDELPQLLNVIKGDMSLVGPRPYIPLEDANYALKIRGYTLRYLIKPGMTGLAQANGSRGQINSIDELQKRTDFDLFYLSHLSPSMDIKIMFKTVARIFNDPKAF